VSQIQEALRSTHDSSVLDIHGAFGACVALSGYREPILVSGTDGVGTKVEVARAANALDTIGIDLVAMSVNDILCHGARPLFFLDYIAVDRLDATEIARIVAGVAEGCRLAGAALVGGETAEMSGVYQPGRFDLAGCAVGVVERDLLIDGSRIEAGASVIGIASSGFHANGFSLLRALFPEIESDRRDESLRTPRSVFLTPTRIYARVVGTVRSITDPLGIAHITGGGWVENLPRLLGNSRDAHALDVDSSLVPRPSVYDEIESRGVTRAEIYRTFNVGLGLAIAVSGEAAAPVIAAIEGLGIGAWEIGRVVAATGADAGTVTIR
jgi:phosphoribosylformylglycinamidine cyclo-ligase